jgi:23S rRNA pseudouridine2457 synthase
MAQIVLFNKPFNVLTQFRTDDDRVTLAHFIHDKSLRVAGRLDYDSEGLLLLTDHGHINSTIADPKFKHYKTYWAQVEGIPDEAALQQLRDGVTLNDGATRPAKVEIIAEPESLWQRQPPIRHRANIPTTWLKIQISEGRNRQVRRMTAAIGFPTLRLIRSQIADFRLDLLQPGEMKVLRDVDYPDLFSSFLASSPNAAKSSRFADGAAKSRLRSKRRNTFPIGPFGK